MNDKYNRAQFEQYAESQGLRDFEYDQDDASRYRNPFTQREWNYWVAALECVALAARATPAQPVPDAVDAVLLEMQPGGALYQPPSPMDEKRLLDIAHKMPQRPWGIGSRRADAIAFAWEVLKAVQSPASDVSAPSPSSVGAAIRKLPLPEPEKYKAFGDMVLSSWEKDVFARGALAMRSEAAALAEQVQGQKSEGANG